MSSRNERSWVVSRGQLPRCTTRLRGHNSSKQLPPVDQLYLRLENEEFYVAYASSLKSSSNNKDGLLVLEEVMFGAGGATLQEKEKKKVLDRYKKVVLMMLGNDSSIGDHLVEYCIACWKALRDLPPAEEDYVRRKGKKALIQPAIESLTGACGFKVEEGRAEEVYNFYCLFRERFGNHDESRLNSFIALTEDSDESFSGDLIRFASMENFQLSSTPPSATLQTVCGINIPYWTPPENPTFKCFEDIEHKEAKLALVSEEHMMKAEELAMGGKKQTLSNRDVGAVWLQQWIQRVGRLNQMSSIDDSIATQTAVMIITPDLSDDMLAAELFDLLGEAVFENAEQLILHRKNLEKNITCLISRLRKEEDAIMKESKELRPTYGPSISVISESEKNLLRAERKAEKKAKKSGLYDSLSHVSDIEWLAINGLQRLVSEEKDAKSAELKIVLGNGIEFNLGEGYGKQGVLPKGTVRMNYKGYEEVKIPAIPTAEMNAAERLVLIENLPNWAQLAFGGYVSLNRIQSRIFPAAFQRNENILVCAPTGAGKTNIAMLCILHEIGLNMEGDEIRLDQFKIVYVAPMKALAAEMTASFSRRLEPLNCSVRELTGDMQLSKKEMEECQMIVTTPEKWDVITRKGGEVAISSQVKLLIIDEVHLLNDDRGSVIETIVARTTRQVETSQSMIRIVGLSATLPNYGDVAEFLGVNSQSGLFYFDASYRPVPLETTFVGISEKNFFARQSLMDDVCYQKIVYSLKRGHQAMVFVHSRKDTGKTARMLLNKSQQNGDTAIFDCSDNAKHPLLMKDARKSKNRELLEVFEHGIGIHHAGMLRSDRTLVERSFSDGIIKVLCCTATLAWGVNLPAHTVIIKGTQLYNPQKGGFTDLGMLDVQQIFGRAGRPQYQDSGEAAILTTHDKLAHYLGMISHSVPIESRFIEGLADHLNAEIVLGTVTNLREAVAWLGYTYLYVRMKKNPLPYGIGWEELALDHDLVSHRQKLVIEAARVLDRSRMVRFDEKSGNLYTAEMGRVASHFYIKQASIEAYNRILKPHMNEEDALYVISVSSEFETLNIRDEELPELDEVARRCFFHPRGGADTKHGKANILLQAYISRMKIESFSLVADLNYASQNAPRVARALFEICMNKSWPSAAELFLLIAKSLEWQLWPSQHPLWQFEASLKPNILLKLDDLGFDILQLKEMSPGEIGSALRHPAAGTKVFEALSNLPSLVIDAKLMPITRTVVQIELTITSAFKWRDTVHGSGIKWHLWVEDSDNERMYHSETWILTKQLWKEGSQKLSFAVPVKEPLPSQYYVKAIADSWMGSETTTAISFKGLLLPDKYPPHTELLNLDPLPKHALKNPKAESMYRFSHFNPIQTQAFHALYHSDENVLLGAPTGSGKTVSSELTLLRLFNAHPNLKAVFIAPLKALVRERMKDWGQGFAKQLNLNIVEMTGDITPDLKSLLSADIIVTTPEKWDGISRNWHSRPYVRAVGLVIMDEIHLLGADRGPILEVIVSRMRYIAAQSNARIRFVGLSTALANASDLADWLGVRPKCLFNFKPSVRPVPLECHIQGYPGKFYCPRMATMNKPAYAAIQTHSPVKPVLIFVASRRQTRLTALDLITYAAADDRPRTFLKMDPDHLEYLLDNIHDGSLRHTIQFGIGLHHAGLSDSDRNLVERLYVEGGIQVLVATSTLAWGVNTPAHLVIVKGTEFYDAPSKRYVDYPITDVLQMMGRAGRPQFDKRGVAVIMVHEPKKSFYKKFLYEPFPVESSLHLQLEDHMNAEIASGTISNKQDAVDYLTWTFLIRRLLQNPSYYGLSSTQPEIISSYLSNIVEKTFHALEDAGCIYLDDDTDLVEIAPPGKVASLYYLKHKTMQIFESRLHKRMDVPEIIEALCSASEYEELPVRHNEDNLNAEILPTVRYPPKAHTVDKPSTKAYLLIQSHLSRLPLPIADYITDTRSVLDNSMRILQALVDVTAEAGWWDSCLSAMHATQCIIQGRWHDEEELLQLPHIENEEMSAKLKNVTGARNLKELLRLYNSNMPRFRELLEEILGGSRAREVEKVLRKLPLIYAKCKLKRGKIGTKIEVEVTRHNKRSGPRGSSTPKAYTPCFPKVKEEGWWCAVIRDSSHILALKRLSFGSKNTTTSTFDIVEEVNYDFEVKLICDSYIGLDITQLHTLEEVSQV